MKLKKQELVVLRAATYKPPPEKRCDTCRHIGYFKTNCQAIAIRGVRQRFDVHPGGICDLWEART